ncbi:MAG: hypothetical protein MR209_04250 [Veillonellaceae bacterium]|nr:hypothetical protein [Veillonellaceae bacterium]
MKYSKREVELDGLRETFYIFEPPWETLSDVFAVEVLAHGAAIRKSLEEVLDYEYDSAYFQGDVYSFSMYRDVTLVDRGYEEYADSPVEVDTRRLYRVIGTFLQDNHIAVDGAEWEED